MDKKAQDLLKRYAEGNTSEAENAIIESWYLKYQDPNSMQVSEEELETRSAKIASALPVTKKISQARVITWRSVAAACIVAVAIITGLYLYPYSYQKSTAIIPGGNKAVLQIANGKKIDLSSQKDGIISTGTGLRYNDGSAVPGLNDASTGVQELNLSTPKGGQYQLVLSDGTKVWLNAASSITYPSRFDGKERTVKVTGEAYFDVVHNPSQPFRVESNGQSLEVLGTSFNITAYTNDKYVKTTLINGKVKINSDQPDKKATILNPGQQLQISAKESKLVNDVDLEEITAWKDGYFKFNESLESIMAKIARWYDVDIIYQGNIDGNLNFVGKISRSKDLSAILEIIESASNVHFKVEGRHVIVTK